MAVVPIAALVSGGGTNLQALIDSQEAGILRSGKIALVVSNNSRAPALERAAKYHIPAVVAEQKNFDSPEGFDRALLETLEEYRIQLVVLAGFLAVLGQPVLQAYPDRIINIHPALLPAFGGKGFYGLKVHQAALDRGVKITGATVHYVDENIDGGKIILQKAVEVREGDTPEILQKRVMEQAEWQLLPAAAELVCRKIAGFEG
ncbi:MAG: phosphoribosylglycinamide formyltransferase [Treponema sp.]|jgi:phosphoribosylglycinamide formyltransferase-1|nr:phosphoribosylglycinamide formyltransferase [Treponema sp.]